ncbi:hypothetical protein E2C01_061401 [Portunus trituberculatus]|uniref:Uncharacterized protein n=1 Tax=Portunus trituberculatus TaxID=210409 RepID=A0A5B7H809_PORTR|nr:hypothetical protein [Portunus trituberculatus]
MQPHTPTRPPPRHLTTRDSSLPPLLMLLFLVMVVVVLARLVPLPSCSLLNFSTSARSGQACSGEFVTHHSRVKLTLHYHHHHYHRHDRQYVSLHFTRTTTTQCHKRHRHECHALPLISATCEHLWPARKEWRPYLINCGHQSCHAISPSHQCHLHSPLTTHSPNPLIHANTRESTAVASPPQHHSLTLAPPHSTIDVAVVEAATSPPPPPPPPRA